MIIEILEEDSIVRWKYNTNEPWKCAEISDLIMVFNNNLSTVDERIKEIIEELESRKDYGVEYAQAMEDVIVILKAKFDTSKELE